MRKIKDIKWKELILKNFGLKILAAILAVLLWIVIVNIDNPSEKKTITDIPVELHNTGIFTDNGYIYQVEDGNTVTISVKAPKAIVDELRASDFYAYADIDSEVIEKKTVPIHIKCMKEDVSGSITILSQKTDYVKFAVDTKIEKEFDVEPEVTGTPAKGYVIGSVSVSPTTIKVTGAKSKIDSIHTAKVTYNIDNMNSDIEDMVTPSFYDETGKEIDFSNITLNRNTVKLTIEILPSKTVPINYNVQGTPGNGYICTEIDANIEQVNIAAPRGVLSGIEGIDIPDGTIDITNLTEDKVFEISLNKYLPSGVRVINSTNVFIVTAKIDTIVNNSITMTIDDVEVKGMNDTYEYDIDSKHIDVVVRGLENSIKNIGIKDLSPVINLEGKGAGNYTVKVEFASSDDFTIPETYYIGVKIKEKATEEATVTEEETSETETASE